jgi:hypothetical protein
MREELSGLVKTTALAVIMCCALLVGALWYIGLLMTMGPPPIVSQVVRGPVEATATLVVAILFFITGLLAARGPLRGALILSGVWLLLLCAIEVPLFPGRIVPGAIALLVSALAVIVMVSAVRSKPSE